MISIQALIELVLVFKKKSQRVEDLETLFCEFSSFLPSPSFVKIFDFVRTDIVQQFSDFAGIVNVSFDRRMKTGVFHLRWHDLIVLITSYLVTITTDSP